MIGSEAQETSLLVRAYNIQQAAAEIGFTWASPHEAMTKIHEELHELEDAIAHKNVTEIKSEAGDLLYSIINFLRLSGIHPNDALQSTTEKFERRLKGMRADMATDQIDFETASLSAKIDYWNRQKIKA